MAVIRNLHEPVQNWTPVAVPLASVLHFERRLGRTKPVIRRTLVDLTGEVFRTFGDKREQWRFDGDFCQPGPIQFWGPEEIVEPPCFSIISN